MRQTVALFGRLIFWTSMILTVFGLLAVLSSSMGTCALSRSYDYNSLYLFERQALFMVVGLVGMYFARHRLNLDKARKLLSTPFMFGIIFLAFCVLFTTPVNGARRWIHLGPLNLQVGELAKLAIIFFWADFLARHESAISLTGKALPQRARRFGLKMDAKRKTYTYIRSLWSDVKPILPALALTVVLFILIELGKDLGTIIILSLIVLSFMVVSGVPLRLIYSAFACAGVFGVLMIAKEPYRLSRLSSWVSPLSDKADSGYQIINSFIAIASGGLIGRGMPYSLQKFSFLPEQHCDFIFAIISEEIGFLGVAGLLVLFFIFCWAGLRLAVRCKDSYQSLVAFGITFQIVSQTIFNICVVTGIFPNKGLPLPFISYGGSSLIVTLIGVGVLLNIADSCANSGYVASGAPASTSKVMKVARKGATLSSSSERPSVKPVSSGEWEALVAPSRRRPKKASLPRPVIEPQWGQVTTFQPGSRAERERARRREAMEGLN